MLKDFTIQKCSNCEFVICSERYGLLCKKGNGEICGEFIIVKE